MFWDVPKMGCFSYSGYCLFSKWKMLLLSVILLASMLVAEKVDSYFGYPEDVYTLLVIHVALVDGFCCCLWLCYP